MSITPQTVTAETATPRNFQVSCLRGVVPIQYPILRSVMKEPATESAVQTTPPMISAAAIPALPLSPTAISTTDAMISVISVIPLTGLEPTMAMAFAATVVNRKAITPTITRPTSACQTFSTTPPKAKNAKMAIRAMAIPNTMFFMGMSSSVRATFSAPFLSPLNSLTASPRADFITPKDFIMPMIPAVAIPPMPIGLA